MKASDYFYRIGQSAADRGVSASQPLDDCDCDWPEWAWDSYIRGYRQALRKTEPINILARNQIYKHTVYISGNRHTAYSPMRITEEAFLHGSPIF